MTFTVTVVICTHNPREPYLQRVLEALRAQTFPLSNWELLVIDNASVSPLEGRLELSWHPQGRIIRENELGLTPARLRGIAEGRSDLLLFVDDDNVLDSDYVAQAAALAERLPIIGVFG